MSSSLRECVDEFPVAPSLNETGLSYQTICTLVKHKFYRRQTSTYPWVIVRVGSPCEARVKLLFLITCLDRSSRHFVIRVLNSAHHSHIRVPRARWQKCRRQHTGVKFTCLRTRGCRDVDRGTGCDIDML